MTVDMHCHWIPDALADALRSREAPPRLVPSDDTEQLIVYRETLPFGPAYTEIDSRLARMDRFGVDRHVLSCPGLFGIDSLPAKEAAPLLALFNEAAGDLARRNPDRFSALAALPFDDIDLAVAELARARKTFGHVGAILPANAFLTLETAKRLAPVFEKGQQLGAHFFIHPGPTPDDVRGEADSAPAEHDNAGQRHITLDVQAILTHVMVTLLYTDFLAPYPDVSVQVANLGGALPFLIERMDHVSALRTPDAPLPSASAGRVYVDCSSFGARSIALAAALFGWDRILLGTDHPIFDTERTLRAVDAAAPDPAARDAVLRGNAERLLADLS